MQYDISGLIFFCIDGAHHNNITHVCVCVGTIT